MDPKENFQSVPTIQEHSSTENFKEADIAAFKQSVKYGSLYTALALIQADKVPSSLLQETEIFENIKKQLVQMYASSDRGRSAGTLVENFKIDQETKSQIIEKALIKNIETPGFNDTLYFQPDYISYLKQEGGFSEEEMQKIGDQVAEQLLTKFSSYYLRDYLPKLKDYGLITEEQVIAVAPSAIKNCLANGKPDQAAALLETYPIDKAIVSTEEITEAGKKKIIQDLQRSLYVRDILEAKQKYLIPNDFFESPEFKKSLERHLLDAIRGANIEKIKEIKENFGVDESSLNKEEIEKAQIYCICNKVYDALYESSSKNPISLDRNFEEKTLQLAKDINFEGNPFDNEEIKKRGQEGFIHVLQDRDYTDLAVIKNIKELFDVDPETISSHVSTILMQRDTKYKDVVRQEFRGNFERKLRILDELNVDVGGLLNNKDFIDSLDDEYRGSHGFGFSANSINLELIFELKERNLINNAFLTERLKHFTDILAEKTGRAAYVYKEGKDAFLSELDNLVSFKEKLGLEIPDWGVDSLLTKLIEKIGDKSESSMEAINIVKEKFSVPESRMIEVTKNLLDRTLYVSSHSTITPQQQLIAFQKITTQMDLPYEVYGPTLEKYILGQADAFSIERILEMKIMFKVPDEKMEDVLKEYLSSKTAHDKIEEFEKNLQGFEKKFDVLGASVEKITKPVIIKYLGSKIIKYEYHSDTVDNLSSTPENQGFIKKYNLSDSDITEAAVSQLLNQAKSNNFSRVVSIMEQFNLNRETMFANPVVEESFFKAITKMIANEEIEEAEELAEKLQLKLDPEKILRSFPQAGTFMEQLRLRLPALLAAFPASLQEVMSIIQLSEPKNSRIFWETIDKYPFLVNAITENQRFSKKLILYFHNFDKISKENITLLYNTKEQIIAGDQDIDPGSLEFRQGMQAVLQTYKNNPALLKEFERNNINTQEWLNYGHEEYFPLGEAESVPFSELVKTPVFRIRETIETYTDVVKNALRDFQPELQAASIALENIAEIDQKIALMESEQEKAKQVNDDAKVQGIEKGLLGLRAKKENPKQVSAWMKLNNDIAAVTQISDKVIAIQEEILGVEEHVRKMEVMEVSPKEKRRSLQAYKERTNALKGELKKDLDVMELRMENFQKSLPEILSPILGAERQSSIMQETAQQTGEVLDHYQTDYSILKKLFNEQIGDSGKLEGRPMRIQISSRNPDSDLYLGNYTECCIRIDSTHMGSESTIADYLTDLGMQIVEIIDEKKEEPIAAAWLFVGRDENGSAGLVVDNIEANTEYSSRFNSQLSEKLREYINAFAVASNLPNVAQGTSNNDLVIAGMDKNYTKLGGANRSDGYYLEAENDDDDDNEYGHEDDNNDDDFTPDEDDDERERLEREY